ncbi:hypothetical protein E4U55_005615 [Claviceps digitariae]|nr:hypothetical protein E4U55_005615 [Claviceps digitariae]
MISDFSSPRDVAPDEYEPNEAVSEDANSEETRFADDTVPVAPMSREIEADNSTDSTLAAILDGTERALEVSPEVPTSEEAACVVRDGTVVSILERETGPEAEPDDG